MTDHVTQAAELVERLRRNTAEAGQFEICPVLVTQAADLIARLSAELAARSGGDRCPRCNCELGKRTKGICRNCGTAISSMEAPSHD